MGPCCTRQISALSSCCDVAVGRPKCFQSFTSLILLCFPTRLLWTAWWNPSWRPIILKDIPVECIPIIFHLCASDNSLVPCWHTMIQYCKKLALNNPYAPYFLCAQTDFGNGEGGKRHSAMWSSAVMLEVSHHLYGRPFLLKPLLTLTPKVCDKNRIHFCQGC